MKPATAEYLTLKHKAQDARALASLADTIMRECLLTLAAAYDAAAERLLALSRNFIAAPHNEI
jgi:hypothetical protein